jgi:type I restriction enzyme R subunit
MTEDQLEQEALGWLSDVGYTLLNGYEIVVDGTTPERPDYKNTLIPFRLLETINRLNSIISLPSNFENSILGEIPSC